MPSVLRLRYVLCLLAKLLHITSSRCFPRWGLNGTTKHFQCN